MRGGQAVGNGKGKNVAYASVSSGSHDMEAKRRGGWLRCGGTQGSHIRTWERNRSLAGPGGAEMKARIVACLTVTVVLIDAEAAWRGVG